MREPFWSAAFQRRFLSFCFSDAARKKESGDESPHSKRKGSAMSQQRQRGGDRRRQQQRLRGRLRTEQMREGQDELDLPDAQLQAGLVVDAHESGWDDDRDGDALLAEQD